MSGDVRREARRYHWTEVADRVYEGHYIGECDNGDLWAPRRGSHVGWTRFNPRNLRHQWLYLRSRCAGRLVWLETS